MPMTKLGVLCAATLFALTGAAANAASPSDAAAGTPFCSKTVTDNCMQREGHAVAAHRGAEHRTAARHHGSKHRVAWNHAKRHHKGAHHRKMAAKAVPAPTRKM